MQSGTKTVASIVSIIIGLLCVVTVIAGMFKAISKPALDMPMFSMILGESEVNVAKENLKATAEHMEEMYDIATDEEIEEMEAIAGVSVDELIDDIRELSLNDAIKYSAIPDLDIDSDLYTLFNIFRWVVIGYALFIALFSLLGALIRKKVFTILANIFCPIFFIAFVGWEFLAVFIVLSIIHVVLVSIARSKPAVPPVTYYQM